MGKRTLFRSTNGRFKKTPSLQQLGFEVATSKMTCICGHVFMPVLKSGFCPVCGSQEKKQNE